MSVLLRGDTRQTLKTYSWARAQHRLRLASYTAGFTAARDLIATETGVEPAKVAAVLAGGFSSRDTQERLARWNGLRLATCHGKPVLVADYEAAGAGPAADPVPLAAAGCGAVPLTPETVKARVRALLGSAADEPEASGRAAFAAQMRPGSRSATGGAL
jgi:hypothetical protein